MATENKRKSSRNFRLDKPVERKFDLDKEDEVVSSGSTDSSSDNSANAASEKSNNKVWLWFAAAVVVGLLIWLFIPSGNNSTPVQDTVGIEQTEETPSNDSALPVEAVDGDEQQPEMASDEESEPEQTQSEPDAQPTQIEPSAVSAPSTPSQPLSTPSVGSNVEAEALKVIRGDYGVGQERKDKLGSNYAEIQGKVNEMYRQGLVK